MQLVRSIVFDALVYTWMIVFGGACMPAAIFSRDAAYWVMRNYSRSSIWLLRVICGVRTEVRGQVPTGEVLVASKHQSFLDILMLSAVLPRFKFIMKKELVWVPILGFYALRIGATPVNRGKRSEAMKSMVARMDKERRDPGQVVIYPQGTRVAPGVKAPYKIGAGVLYERFGLPCVPAATNVGVFWGRRKLLKKPGLAVIEFLDPIPAHVPLREFMRLIEDRVETASDALLAETASRR
jgi:1-acyl-sn-glycerol-3-phosphate acyltransferase